MVEKFQNNEHGYLAWLAQHPHGFVVNTTKRFSSFRKIHRATCSSISTYSPDGSSKLGRFTENQYIKLCSLNPRALERWHKQNQGRGRLPVCKKCKPYSKAGIIISLSNLQKLQDASLDRPPQDTPEERDARLAKARKKPKWVTVKIKIPLRNQDVRAAVLDRAKGRCQDCGKNAPFKRGNSPYLEVHHKTPLARNGDDTVRNAIALCPNCHRKAHYAMDGSSA